MFFETSKITKFIIKMKCKLLNLVYEAIFEMKLKLKLHLYGISEENMYNILLYSNKKNFDRDSNLKFCLRPGLGAQKVEKHWPRQPGNLRLFV